MLQKDETLKGDKKVLNILYELHCLAGYKIAAFEILVKMKD